jgi:hypothetical protein
VSGAIVRLNCRSWFSYVLLTPSRRCGCGLGPTAAEQALRPASLFASGTWQANSSRWRLVGGAEDGPLATMQKVDLVDRIRRSLARMWTCGRQAVEKLQQEERLFKLLQLGFGGFMLLMSRGSLSRPGTTFIRFLPVLLRVRCVVLLSRPAPGKVCFCICFLRWLS